MRRKKNTKTKIAVSQDMSTPLGDIKIEPIVTAQGRNYRCLSVMGLFSLALVGSSVLSAMNKGQEEPANQSPIEQTNFLSKYSLLAPDPISTYRGIPVIDISLLPKQNCTSKIRGHSDGLICNITDEQVFLKTFKDKHQDELLGAYNLKLLKDTMRIKVPDPMIASDSGKFYFASAKVPNFISADTLMQYPHEFRDKIAEKIGETGISKYMVAVSFIDDLKPENWGFDNDGLVIIDVDIAPRTLNDFYTRNNQFFKSNITLTLANIEEMRSIYTTMLENPILPRVHDSVDLTKEIYTHMLNVYIRTCDHVLKKFSNDPQFHSEKPSSAIVTEFAESVAKVGKEFHNETYCERLLNFVMGR